MFKELLKKALKKLLESIIPDILGEVLPKDAKVPTKSQLSKLIDTHVAKHTA